MAPNGITAISSYGNAASGVLSSAERHRDAGAVGGGAAIPITYSFNPANGDPTGGIANDTSRTISWVVNDEQ